MGAGAVSAFIIHSLGPHPAYARILQSSLPNSTLPQSEESESCSVVSDSLRPHGLYSPWNSPGQNTGVGSLSLLQGIFPTQADPLPAEPQGSPKVWKVVTKESLARLAGCKMNFLLEVAPGVPSM